MNKNIYRDFQICIGVPLTRFSKISFSIWLKINSKPGWPGGGFQLDLGRNAGLSQKSSEALFQKFHLIRILLANTSKSFRDLWTSEKSIPFSKTWISISDNALSLRLKIVLEQNELGRRLSSLMVVFVGKLSDHTTELPIAKFNLESSFLNLPELRAVLHLIYLRNWFYSPHLVLDHLSYRMR